MFYKLALNTDCPQVKRDIENVHEMHRTVCRMFDKGALWRLDRDTLYVRGKPLRYIPQGYALSVASISDIWSEQMEFSLLVNPTVARRMEGKKRSSRIPADDPLEWLVRKGEVSGFEVTDASIVRQRTITGHKPGHRLVFNAVDFRGDLLVVDWYKFTVAVKNGIGSAKGYGFGLLLCRTKGGGCI